MTPGQNLAIKNIQYCTLVFLYQYLCACNSKKYKISIKISLIWIFNGWRGGQSNFQSCCSPVLSFVTLNGYIQILSTQNLAYQNTVYNMEWIKWSYLELVLYKG